MLREVHEQVHRIDLTRSRKKKISPFQWKRNYKIITDVAENEPPIDKGNADKIIYSTDELVASILTDLAMNYYSCPAEHHFATTHSCDIFTEHARYYARLFFINARKKTPQVYNRISGPSGLSWNIEEGPIASSSFFDPLSGSRFGHAYTHDSIRLDLLPSVHVRASKVISWSKQSRLALMRIFRGAKRGSMVWSALSRRMRDIEYAVDELLRSRAGNIMRQPGRIAFVVSNCRVPDSYEIRFEYDPKNGYDRQLVELVRVRHAEQGANSNCTVIYKEISDADNLNVAAKLSILSVLCGITDDQFLDALVEKRYIADPRKSAGRGQQAKISDGAVVWSPTETKKILCDLALKHYKDGKACTRHGDHNAAMHHYSDARNYDSNDGVLANFLARAYGSLGLSHSELLCYNVGIKKLSDSYEEIINRGTTRLSLGDTSGALSDFRYVNRKSPELWRRSPYLCMLRRIGKNKRIGYPLIENLLRLLGTISTFLSAQWQGRGEDFYGRQMHYSNLCTAFALAQGRRFRLMCADSMDDRSEGSVFRKRLVERCQELRVGDTKIEDLRKYIGDGSGRVYIGSFDCSGTTRAGRDAMWREYGKHKEVPYAGCALTFDQAVFSKSADSGFDHLMNYQYQERSPLSMRECCIYRVTYDAESQRQAVDSIIKDLLEISMDKHAEIVRDIVRDCLDSVRYIFKDASFRVENETRLLVWRNDMPSKDGVVKRDSRGRKYVECPSEFFPSVVLLGKNVTTVEAVVDRLRSYELIRQRRTNLRPI